MAMRVEEAFGVPMETLMRMQNSFDIAQARKREGGDQGRPLCAKRPVSRKPTKAAVKGVPMAGGTLR